MVFGQFRLDIRRANIRAKDCKRSVRHFSANRVLVLILSSIALLLEEFLMVVGSLSVYVWPSIKRVQGPSEEHRMESEVRYSAEDYDDRCDYDVNRCA